MIRPFKFICVLLMVHALFFFPASIFAVETTNSVVIPQKISLDYKNAELTDVLKAISYSYNLNIVVTKDVTGKVSAQLSDLTLDEALKAILTVNNYSYVRKGSIIYVVPKDDMDLVTESIPLHYIPLKEAKELLSGALPKFKGVIQEGNDSNNLVITSNPVDMDNAKEVLKGIDVPPIQVLIEAQIIDISKSDLETIDSAVNVLYSSGKISGGFSKFSPKIVAGSNSVSSSSTSSSSSSSSTGGDSGTLSFNNGNNPQASINALVQSHKAHILASPSIATLNGHEATILIGEKYPYTASSSSSGPNGVINQSSVSFVDIGTKLKVTPRVSPDGWITMKISPEVSSLKGVVDGNPDITTRSAETEVRVKNNQTIVIGGLKSKSDLRDRNGIPYLKDIPFLGALFTSHDSTLTDGELTVLITPHIIPMPQSNKKTSSNAPSESGEESHLIESILDYAQGLEGDKSKDNAKNLYFSSEQIKSYKMILRQFPDSGKGDFCLYRIAFIYAKEFGKCDASRDALNELRDLDPASPYIPVTEALVDACKAVSNGSKDTI